MTIRALFPNYVSKWRYLNLDQLARRFSPDTNLPNPFLDPEWMNETLLYVHNTLMGSEYTTYGGFFEERSHLWRGHYHEGNAIHLGTDFNVPSGIRVNLPGDGILVESFQDPDQEGGWGGKLTFNCGSFFLTFGHLDDILSKKMVGKKVRAGTTIGFIGTPERNGGWFNHLHVQASRTFDPNRDGYVDHFYKDIEKDFFDPVWAINQHNKGKN